MGGSGNERGKKVRKNLCVNFFAFLSFLLALAKIEAFDKLHTRRLAVLKKRGVSYRLRNRKERKDSSREIITAD
jgi:hypothetical protein